MSIVPSIFRRPSAFDPFSMDIWDPFEALRDISPSASTRANEVVSAVANAQIDWKETENAHVFKADLPGLRKEEVKVEIQDSNVLQISGERNKEEEEKNDKWHRVERARGKFVRRFRLPDNAVTDEIRASMDNGVLTVNVPKRPQPQPQVKSIDISG